MSRKSRPSVGLFLSGGILVCSPSHSPRSEREKNYFRSNCAKSWIHWSYCGSIRLLVRKIFETKELTGKILKIQGLVHACPHAHEELSSLASLSQRSAWAVLEKRKEQAVLPPASFQRSECRAPDIEHWF